MYSRHMCVNMFVHIFAQFFVHDFYQHMRISRPNGVEYMRNNGVSVLERLQAWMMSSACKNRRVFYTWNTSVDNPEEFLVAARVSEERRIDGH